MPYRPPVLRAAVVGHQGSWMQLECDVSSMVPSVVEVALKAKHAGGQLL